MPALARNLILVLFGYALAVVVAVFFCVLVFLGWETLSSPETNRPLTLQDFSTIYVIGLNLTASTAWPGFVATVAASRWRGYRSWVYFALCGVGTAIFAVLFLYAVEGSSGLVMGLLTGNPAIYVGGLAGGFAYALLARRLRVFVKSDN